jgi:hypothetical protein
MKRYGRSRVALGLLAICFLLHGAGAGATSINLPLPIYLETFEEVTEGGLPAGWYQSNYSDLTETFFDFHDLDSAF